MASAAAVGANIPLEDERSPNPTNLEDPVSISGTLQSAILPADEEVPDNLDEDEDDDDVVTTAKRRGPTVNGDLDDGASGAAVDDDLFGDAAEEEEEGGGGGEEEEEEPAPAKRQLDDEELDSGDDEGRHDRVADEDEAAEPQTEEIQETILSADFDRQPVPEPSDGEMYLMKVPDFLAFEPKTWNHRTFQPPSTDHHSRTGPSETFSAYNTALSTIRWRHSPSKPQQLQSNARILRWSDGSLTLQLASNPTQQYEIGSNSLAPRQRNPIKPTPQSIKPGERNPKEGRDMFTYLAAPNQSAGLLRVTHKITTALSVNPSADTTDDSVERLKRSLATAAHGKVGANSSAIEMAKVDEDPELARKKAEVAEREKQRARKRREAAEMRESERTGRVLGRSGGARAGGLTAGMLEDDEMGAPRPRRKAPARRQRRNSEYSEDEDFGRKRGNFGGDEYENDDFVVASDEEEEAPEDDDEDIDDGIVEPERPSKRRSPAPAADDGDEDEGAEVVQASRGKRRRVLDDEDEEE